LLVLYPLSIALGGKVPASHRQLASAAVPGCAAWSQSAICSYSSSPSQSRTGDPAARFLVLFWSRRARWRRGRTRRQGDSGCDRRRRFGLRHFITAILALTHRYSVRSRWFDPHYAIPAGGHHSRQCAEMPQSLSRQFSARCGASGRPSRRGLRLGNLWTASRPWCATDPPRLWPIITRFGRRFVTLARHHDRAGVSPASSASRLKYQIS